MRCTTPWGSGEGERLPFLTPRGRAASPTNEAHHYGVVGRERLSPTTPWSRCFADEGGGAPRTPLSRRRRWEVGGATATAQPRCRRGRPARLAAARRQMRSRQMGRARRRRRAYVWLRAGLTVLEEVAALRCVAVWRPREHDRTCEGDTSEPTYGSDGEGTFVGVINAVRAYGVAHSLSMLSFDGMYVDAGVCMWPARGTHAMLRVL